MNKEELLKYLKNNFLEDDIEILSFSGMSKPFKYKCNICSKISQIDRANRIYSKKYLCYSCKMRDSSIRKWIYNFFDNNSNFTLLEWTGVTSNKIKIKCDHCENIFYKSPANLYQKNEKSICPYCGENGSPVLLKEYENKLIKIFGANEYTILNYKNITSKATFKHKCGFVFMQKANNFLNGRGCPKCFKTISKGELKIIDFLNKKSISYERQKKFKDLNKLSYDFYIPEYRLLIEYQGEQHYKPIEIFGGEEVFKKQIIHDEEKDKYAKINNYRLLKIPYFDIDKIDYILSDLVQRLSLKGVASSEAK